MGFKQAYKPHVNLPFRAGFKRVLHSGTHLGTHRRVQNQQQCAPPWAHSRVNLNILNILDIPGYSGM